MEENKEYLSPYSQNDKDVEANNLAPISSRLTSNQAAPGRLAVSRTTTRGSSRSRCHGGQDGYSVFTQDDDPDVAIEPPEDKERDVDFIVKWAGGDEDPKNPRSMGNLRKWLIVFVVSLSSLCV